MSNRYSMPPVVFENVSSRDHCFDFARPEAIIKEIGDRYKDTNLRSRYLSSMTLLLEGWPKGRQDAQELHRAVWDVVGRQIEDRSNMFDVSGYEVDVDRFLTGEPDCMREHVYSETENKLVDIWINVSYSEGISSDLIFRRGAAALALVDGLEQSGKRCRISIVDTGAKGLRVCTTKMTLKVGIKDHDEALDMDRAAYMFASDEFLRHFLFTLYECTPHAIQAGAYALPIDLIPPQDTIYMGKMLWNDPQWQSNEAAVEWVLTQLKIQGVSIK